MKDLQSENYKTLIKETEDDTKKWKTIPCSQIRRILLNQPYYPKVKVKVKSCLPLCDPMTMGFSRQEYWSGLPFPSPKVIYKFNTILNKICDIFHTTRTNNPINHMEPQNFQSHLEKKGQKFPFKYFIPPLVCLNRYWDLRQW